MSRSSRAAQFIEQNAKDVKSRLQSSMSELETGALGPGRIEPRELEQEMRSSYLDYAMSVIVGSRAARCARRAQAGAPPRPVLMWRTATAAGPSVCEVRAHRRRRDGQPSPARRSRDLRHARPAGAAVLAPLSAGRQPGELRLDRRRPAGREALHRGPPRQARRRRCSASIDSDTVDFSPNYDGKTPRAGRPALPLPEPARQRLVGDRRRNGDQHAAASPGRGRSTPSSR